MQQLFMEKALSNAKRSTCYRLNVGAVIVDPVYPNAISDGYNGAAPKEPHCTGNTCPGRIPGMCPTIHAEVNALKKVPYNAVFHMYVSNSPCPDCCEYIIDDGRVKKVFFSIPYRETSHLKILTDAGIGVFNLTPAGYLVDWLTNDVLELV